MDEKKNLEIKKIFDLAVQNHQKNNFKSAENFYNEVLKIIPNHFETNFLLGSLLLRGKNFNKAVQLLNKAILINPNHVGAHNNLAGALKGLGEIEKAIICFKKAIKINSNYLQSHNNLGIMLHELGKNKKAIEYFKKAIKINPNHVETYNNLGTVFYGLGECKKALKYYKKAIKINPNYTAARWNLHSFSSSIEEALKILKKLYIIDNKYFKAKFIISALEGFKGNLKNFNFLINSSYTNDPFMRSIKWVFSLPKLPKIFFNRWSFFDAIVSLTDQSRPFYEFGVWNGVSFKYLINTFKKGFGFDTFTGLPESWYHEPVGKYSSFGSVPKIKGGKFIVGKFKKTLPQFFSKKKPLASLINFDADLYSSTLCALNNSKDVIDNKTILIFDQFLMSKHWEKDEFKALNEYCDKFDFNYEVLAVSFFSKQVAVKLYKKKNAYNLLNY